MICAIKNINGKVVDVLNNDKPSLLFRTLKSLPFLTEDLAFKMYAFTKTSHFSKQAKDLILNEQNEPLLVFRHLSDNNPLLNASGLVFSTDFNSENELDIQGQGLVFGFLRGNEKIDKKTIKVYHGTYDKKLKKFKERGDILWFTDDKKVADQYRKRSIIQTVEFELPQDVNSIDELGIEGIETIAAEEKIDLTKGQIIEGNILMNKPLDLTNLDVNVDNVKVTWNNLYKLGLLDTNWNEFDEEQIAEIEDDYKGKALWVLLEGENVYDRAKKEGYDSVMIKDVGIDGKPHISYGLLDVNKFFNKNTNVSVIEANFSEAIENIDRQSVLEMTYPDGTRKFAIQNSNLFVPLETWNKNVTPNTYDGFIAHLDKLGIKLDTKVQYNPESFRKGVRVLGEENIDDKMKRLLKSGEIIKNCL